MVVTSVVCPILSRLCHGRVIAAAQLRRNSPRGSLRHLGKRSQYNHVEGWVKGKEQQKSLWKRMWDKTTRGKDKNMGLVHCLTECFGDCSKLLDMNSCYKADLLEYVRGTAVALVLATNRILARIFWQHAFWEKSCLAIPRGSVQRWAECSKSAKTLTVLLANRTFFPVQPFH